MPWEDQIRRGFRLTVPFWTPFAVLALWLAYERDWFALVLLAFLGLSYRLVQMVIVQIFRAGANEPAKPSWWDEAVDDLPHPSEQGHSAEVLRHKYRRAVRKIYP